MLKAIISDATAGLGRGREAVSDVGGDGKKRNRAAIRGDIFKKKSPTARRVRARARVEDRFLGRETASMSIASTSSAGVGVYGEIRRHSLMQNGLYRAATERNGA